MAQSAYHISHPEIEWISRTVEPVYVGETPEEAIEKFIEDLKDPTEGAMLNVDYTGKPTPKTGYVAKWLRNL